MLSEEDPLYRISGFGIITPGDNGLGLRAVVTGIQRLTGSLTSLSVGPRAPTDDRFPSLSDGASQADSWTGSWPSLSLRPRVDTSVRSPSSVPLEGSQAQPGMADFVQKHSGEEVVYCDEDLVNCEVLYRNRKPEGRIVTDALVDAQGNPRPDALLDLSTNVAEGDISQVVQRGAGDISQVVQRGAGDAADPWASWLRQQRRSDLDDDLEALNVADAKDAQGAELPLEPQPQQTGLESWEDALLDVDDPAYMYELDDPAAEEPSASREDAWAAAQLTPDPYQGMVRLSPAFLPRNCTACIRGVPWMESPHSDT